MDYNDDIQDSQVQDLVNRSNRQEAENNRLTQVINGMSGERRDENFLHLQISTEEMLDKLEHLFKGDVQGYDEDNNLVWKHQTNNDLIPFNEYGVTSLMEIVTKYIDKNTILSDYPEERIYEILSDIGDELILFILCNYVKMGMDTYAKKTKFRLIVVTTTHVIESTYRRAKNGATVKELNQSRVVGQFGSPSQIQQGRPKKEGFFSRMFN